MGDKMKTKLLNITKTILIMLAIFISFKMCKNIKAINYSNFYYINVISICVLGVFVIYLLYS